MTTPKASSTDANGNRFYPIPHPETRELVELPSWTRLKKLLYSGGLETWKLKKVAAAVATSTSLQMMAADPEQCYSAVRKALAADTAAADIGTMVHKHCEDIDRGTLNEAFVGVAAQPWLDHYRQASLRYGWELVEAEVTVCNHTIGYAGTADRFLRFGELPGIGGGTFCVDMKTGKDVYPDTALQLRAYAGGEWIFEPYDVANNPAMKARKNQLEQDIASGANVPPGRRKWSQDAIKQARAEVEEEAAAIYAQMSTFRPMPADVRLDYGIVIHLTADGCELVPVKLDGADDVIVSLCWINRWQRRKDVVGKLGESHAGPCTDIVHGGLSAGTGDFEHRTPPDQVLSRRDFLQNRLDWIKAHSPAAAQDLASWWLPSGIPTLKTGEPLTDEHFDAIEQRMALVEKTHGVPFEPSTDEILDADAAVDCLEAAFDAWAEDTDPTVLRDLITGTIDKIASTRPHLLADIKAGKDAAGLTKRLRHDEWTVDELLALSVIVRAAAQ